MIQPDIKIDGKWLQSLAVEGTRHWTQAGSRFCGLLARVKYKTAGKGHYDDVLITPEFIDFQNFADWAVVQPGYSEPGWELDKDLLSGPVRIYSPATCCFLPEVINSLLKGRKGRYLPGANKNGNRWSSGVAGLRKTFATEEAAHEWYVAVKAQKLALLADKFEDRLDPRAYDALISWEVNSR